MLLHAFRSCFCVDPASSLESTLAHKFVTNRKSLHLWWLLPPCCADSSRLSLLLMLITGSIFLCWSEPQAWDLLLLVAAATVLSPHGDNCCYRCCFSTAVTTVTASPDCDYGRCFCTLPLLVYAARAATIASSGCGYRGGVLSSSLQWLCPVATAGASAARRLAA